MGTHTIDWREVGTMASIRADLWIYPLKLWVFFPKADCKKIRLELLTPGSANQELSIFSQLANEPIFTPNISKPHLCLGLVPKEMSSGLAGWQEHAVLSIITSQWSTGLREKNPRITRGAEACRAAKDAKITLLHARQGLLLNCLCFQIRMAKWHKTNGHDFEDVMVQKATWWWRTLCVEHYPWLLENSNNNNNSNNG